jgi:uncharacterized membrane protein YgaE (UPF0421/DUF939 family)
LGVKQKKCPVIFSSKKGGAAAHRKGRFSLYTSRIKLSILLLIFLSVVVVSPERERERKRKKSANIERSIFSLRERHTEEEEQRESERRVITLVSFFVR